MNETLEQLVFEKDDVQILFHQLHKVLHIKWAGPVCSRSYGDVIDTLQEMTRELNVETWLFNLSKCASVQMAEKPGQIEKLAHSLVASNLKRFARVISKDLAYENMIQSKISSLNYIYNLKIEVRNFENETEALAWLFDASPGALMEE